MHREFGDKDRHGPAPAGRSVRRADRASRGPGRRDPSPARRPLRPAPPANSSSSDGKVLTADLVVAADGVFSRVRESLLLTKRVDYLDEGYTRLLIPRHRQRPGHRDHGVLERVAPAALRPLHRRPELRLLLLQRRRRDGSRRARGQGELAGVVSRPRRHHREGRERGAGGTGRSASPVDTGRVVEPWSSATRRTASRRTWARARTSRSRTPSSLADYLDRTDDVEAALAAWEKGERPLTDHVQRWTDLYGRVASAWPDRFAHRRSQFLERATKVPWVDNQLNRAARHIPVGAS